MMHSYHRILVIGAGSGRDMASALLITEYLKNQRVSSIDLAGFLTPWALHRFNLRPEKPINNLDISSNKFLFGSTKELKTYFEPLLVTYNARYRLGIRSLYMFSLQNGVKTLCEALQQLVLQNNYDAVFIVDVGGDILATEKQFIYLRTPIVDLACRTIATTLKGPQAMILAVMGPGIDGELPQSEILDTVQKLKKRCALVHTQLITHGDNTYRKMMIVNNAIDNVIGIRAGTVACLDRIMNEKKNFLRYSFTRSITLRSRKWHLSKMRFINRKFARNIFYFDIKKCGFQKLWNVCSKDIFNLHLYFRSKTNGTELDMYFLPMRALSNKTYHLVFSLTPHNDIDVSVRKKILMYGMFLLKTGYYSRVLILTSDVKFVTIPKNCTIKKVKKNYIILSHKEV